MGTPPTALLASLREWASDPRALICLIEGAPVIFPADVIGKTDDELLALVREWCDEG
jgi:hypothetical protein